jgi:hypothetical protein
LLARKNEDTQQPAAAEKNLKRIMRIALLAPVFLLIGNAEGFLEMLHARGLFWDANLTVSRFWQWLDIQDLTNPPALPLSLNPGRLGGTWWWRGSRVLQDYTVTGQSREIIDEFPFFSYLLADLHPHVLAMPAVLLAIYSAFCVFLHSFALPDSRNRLLTVFTSPNSWFLAFTTGSLIFLNTWDFPVYFGLITWPTLPGDHKKGWKSKSLRDFLTFAIPFGVLCIFCIYLSWRDYPLRPAGFYPVWFSAPELYILW